MGVYSDVVVIVVAIACKHANAPDKYPNCENLQLFVEPEFVAYECELNTSMQLCINSSNAHPHTHTQTLYILICAYFCTGQRLCMCVLIDTYALTKLSTFSGMHSI